MRGDSVRKEESESFTFTGESFTFNPSSYLTFLLLLLGKRIVLLLYCRSLWVCNRLHCRVLVCVCVCEGGGGGGGGGEGRHVREDGGRG